MLRVWSKKNKVKTVVKNLTNSPVVGSAFHLPKHLPRQSTVRFNGVNIGPKNEVFYIGTIAYEC